MTNAVQAGFIFGTLAFALTGVANRFPASRIFALCSLLGAYFNAGFALLSEGLARAMAFRFAVGLALAGTYPIGMKLIVSWDPGRAEQSLGLLVGRLTLGTALPHGIRMLGGSSFDNRVPVKSNREIAESSGESEGDARTRKYDARRTGEGLSKKGDSSVPQALYRAQLVPADLG